MIASIVWDVDPILFKVGSWEVRWYGLMWGLGFILAYEMVSRLFKKEKYPEEWVDKLFVYCIVSTVIGARLGHCLFYEWDYYGAHPVEIFKIWKGGLASHGGVFSIILALIIKVVGYYFAEVILYGNWIAPLGSIPGNVVQVGFAGIIVLLFIQQLRKIVK